MRGLPLFPHYVALSALGELGRLFVSRQSTPDALSKLGIAATLAHGVTLLVGAINAAFYPWLLRRLRAAEVDRLRRMSSTVVLTVVLVMLSVSLIAPEAIALLAPAAYHGASDAILPLLYATVPAFLYTLFAGVSLYRERTLAMTGATLFSTLVGVLLNLYLVPRYAYVGAAYATALSYLVLAITHLLACAMGKDKENPSDAPAPSRSNSKRIPPRLSQTSLPVSVPIILVSLILGALPMLLLPPLLDRPLVRYCLLVPTLLSLLLLAYKKRADVLDIQKKSS